MPEKPAPTKKIIIHYIPCIEDEGYIEADYDSDLLKIGRTDNRDEVTCNHCLSWMRSHRV